MARAPTSLLLLIDRRNRLEGELARLKTLKRQSAELYRHISRALDEIDDLLDQHPVELDWSVLEPKITQAKSPFEYGVLTAQVLRALKDAPATGMTSLEVAEVIDASWPESLPRPGDRKDFMLRLRKRLKRLRDDGAVLSPAVGNGHTTSSTWILNKDRWSGLALE